MEQNKKAAVTTFINNVRANLGLKPETHPKTWKTFDDFEREVNARAEAKPLTEHELHMQHLHHMTKLAEQGAAMIKDIPRQVALAKFTNEVKEHLSRSGATQAYGPTAAGYQMKGNYFAASAK